VTLADAVLGFLAEHRGETFCGTRDGETHR
jgi:hypothetical protein